MNFSNNINQILENLTNKQQIIQEKQLANTDVFKNLEEWLHVELTYSSNAIEGNTLTRIETAEVVEKGLSAVIKRKPLKDQIEVINHSKAIDFIKELTEQKKSHQDITETDIKLIHKIILTRIEDTWSGKYRESEIFIKGSSVEFPLPQDIYHKMQEFIWWLNTQQEAHPVKVAADAHLKLVSIHPFIDGNGRTARLLMNLILMINKYPMAIIRNEDRTSYLEAINLAQTNNDLHLYYSLIYEAEERSLDAYLNATENKPVIPILMDRKSTKLLKIGELAKLTNQTKATIRFWTNEGLLKISKTTESNYALYSPTMIDVVMEIKRLQREKRLSVAEIRELGLGD